MLHSGKSSEATHPAGRKRRPMGTHLAVATCVVAGCSLFECVETAIFSPGFTIPSNVLWSSISAAPCSHPQQNRADPTNKSFGCYSLVGANVQIGWSWLLQELAVTGNYIFILFCLIVFFLDCEKINLVIYF